MKHLISSNYTFWIYESKKNAEGKSPLYMRIIVGGKKTEISTGIFINRASFDRQRFSIGKKEPNHEAFNLIIKNLQYKFAEVQRQLLLEGVEFTPEDVKNRMMGNIEDKSTTLLLQFVKGFIKNQNDLKGIDFDEKTIKKYVTTDNHLKDYLKEELKLKDVKLAEIDKKFIKGFDKFLKLSKKHKQNTAAKYLTTFKTILKSAVDDGLLGKNPFAGFPIKIEINPINFLTDEELEKIEKKKFKSERLENIKSIFLFMCYTGLSYCDVEKLTHSEIIEINGKRWINSARIKTNTPIKVPLIEKALKLLNKYSSKAERIFPVPSNQKMNNYLKEIADLCGIDKNVTCHLARKTFATTVTLSKGISIDVVSKLLSHKKMSTTQLYADVVNLKIQNEMSKIDSNFSPTKKQSSKGFNICFHKSHNN